MKKILDSLIFLTLMVVAYLLFFKVMYRFGFTETPFFYYVTACFLLFIILGLTYKVLWQLSALKRKPALYITLTLLFSVILVLPVKICFDTFLLFEQLAETEGKHFEGKIFEGDAVMGHIPIPCASGFLNLRYNKIPLHSIPIKHDNNGFRISDTASCEPNLSGPLVLFLGCSFTEGADVKQEETFSGLVGKSIHGNGLNAGVSSYGFNQMLILARKFIPAYKPDYVVVQYSPWLSERARNRFAPTRGLQIPSPYFADIHDSVKLLPPCYPTSSFSIKYKPDTNRSKFRNFMSFFFHEGFSLVAKDYWKAFISLLQSKAPVSNNEAVEKAFFNETIALTKQYNSKLIVLNLGDISYTHKSHEVLANYKINYAEADSLLWKSVNFNEKDFSRAFYFWGWTGKDSVIIDRHPTARAHALIAESVVASMNRYK